MTDQNQSAFEARIVDRPEDVTYHPPASPKGE